MTVSVHEEDKLETFLRELKRAEDFIDPYMRRAEDSYRAFRQIIDDDAWPYINMIHAPDTLMFVLEAVAKFFNVVFSSEKTFTWERKQGEQSKELVPALDVLTEWMINSSDGEFHSETYDSLWTKSMFGNGYLGVFPFYDKFKNKERVCVGAEFINADYWDLWPDPGMIRFGRKATHVWHRETKDAAQIEAMFKSGEFKGDFQDVPLGPFPEDSSHTELLKMHGIIGWSPEFESQVEVFSRYGDGEVVTLLNRLYIAKDTEKTAPGYLPYDMPWSGTRFIQIANEFYGVGVPEVCYTMQGYKNLILSQHADNMDLILNAIVKARRDAGIDFSKLKAHPHALWLYDDNPEDIDVVQFPDVTSQSAMMNAQFAEGQMERGTSLWRYTLGQEPKTGRETAATVMTLRQAGANRLDAQIKLDERVFWRQVANKIGLLAEDKLLPDIFKRVSGKSKDEVFGDTDELDLQYRVDAVPMGSSASAIGEIRSEQLMQMFQVLTQMDPRLPQNDPEPFRVSLLSILDPFFTALGVPRRIIDKTLIKLEQAGPGGGLGPEGGSKGIPQGALTQDIDRGQLAQALSGVQGE